VKVLDFGISQASWRPRLTDGERVAGTPQYMSPEQACGLRDQIDHRSDQFSLAGIAYTLLTGLEPFRGENAIAVLYEVVHHEPPPPSQVVPMLGAEIDAVVMRGLAKESADRYPNVLAFASALRAAVNGGAAAAFSDPSEPPPVRTPAPALVLPPPEDLPTERPASDRGEIRPAPVAAGRTTALMIRRMRWRQSRMPLHLALLTVAVVMVLAWFAPPTRVPTRAAWHHAGVQARIMFERVLPSREIRP
jgi:serine/threonine-protein kinase